MMNRHGLLLTVILASLPCSLQAAPEATVSDPFQWLEQVQDARALDWARKENRRSLEILENTAEFQDMHREAREILNSTARIPLGTILGKHAHNFWQDKDHVRGLWRRASLDSYLRGEPEWEVLLDVDALSREEGENWVFGELSQDVNCLGPEYERCIVRLSRGGSDASVYREFSVGQKKFVDDGFYLPEAKSQLAWLDPDTLLVGTDWGPESLTESGYARIVKTWKRGTPLQQARQVFAIDAKEMMAAPVAWRSDGKSYGFIYRLVTFFERQLYLLEDEKPIKLPLPMQSLAFGVMQGNLIARLDAEWNYQGARFAQGAVIALDLQDMSVEVVYAPGQGEAVSGALLGASVIHLQILDNVIGRARQARRGERGWEVSTLALPDNGVVALQSAAGLDNGLLVSFESLTTPDTLYYADEQGNVQQVFSLPAFFPAADVQVSQRFAVSKDGTRVPYLVMGRKDVLEAGNAPTIQYGYGGFQIPILPYYYEDPARPQHGALAGRLWVARGGVLVLSNIRGGGEYGPAWHAAALKQQRHLAYEDFFAIGEALVKSGVTTPRRLGAIGRSNGGLLMGVVLTQRPDLYSAIDCGVPLADMLRYHKLLAGASWVGEYGDPDDPAERAYLESYSPYQNLEKDADYPEVFFYTSTADDRVHPGHARKMAAKMQAQGHSFLYYENMEGGHGGTANQDQLAYRTALEYAYFARRLMRDGPEKD